MTVHHPSGQFDTRLTLLARIAQPGPVDQVAWEEFVDQYGPMIYRWCRRWGLQDADAKDVTQQVLLTMPAKMAAFKYNPDGKFRAWLHTLARHAWHDFLERKNRSRWTSAHGELANSLSAVEVRDDLFRRLNEEFDLDLLDEAVCRVRQRVAAPTWEAFRLTAWKSMPAIEVAERLNKKVATIYVARSKVQRMLQVEIEKLRAVEDDLESDAPGRARSVQ